MVFGNVLPFVLFHESPLHFLRSGHQPGPPILPPLLKAGASLVVLDRKPVDLFADR